MFNSAVYIILTLMPHLAIYGKLAEGHRLAFNGHSSDTGKTFGDKTSLTPGGGQMNDEGWRLFEEILRRIDSSRQHGNVFKRSWNAPPLINYLFARKYYRTVGQRKPQGLLKTTLFKDYPKRGETAGYSGPEDAPISDCDQLCQLRYGFTEGSDEHWQAKSKRFNNEHLPLIWSSRKYEPMRGKKLDALFRGIFQGGPFFRHEAFLKSPEEIEEAPRNAINLVEKNRWHPAFGLAQERTL